MNRTDRNSWVGVRWRDLNPWIRRPAILVLLIPLTPVLFIGGMVIGLLTFAAFIESIFRENW